MDGWMDDWMDGFYGWMVGWMDILLTTNSLNNIMS